MGFAVQSIQITDPINHEQAMEMMKSARDVGYGKRRKLANNTYLEWRGPVDDPNSDIAIRLHNTDIVTLHPNGSMTLNSGGWMTITTKERINRYLPHDWRLFQEKGIWYLIQAVNTWPNKIKDAPVFQDGMHITADGTLVNTANPDDIKRTLELNRKINSYATTYAFKLVNGQLEAPGSGDCCDCLMFEPGGMGSKDHLISHLDERYYVPSLLINAMKEYPVSSFTQMIISSHWGSTGQSFHESMINTAETDIRRTVARYLKRHLGLAPYTN